MADIITWKIEDIVNATGGESLCGDKRLAFSGVSIDSRHIGEREVFVAIKGDRHDGHDFLPEVVKSGAGAVVGREDRIRPVADIIDRAGLAAVAVPDTRVALGDMARYQRRQVTLPIVAITGTNGKTTTKEMATRICEQRFQVLSTAGNYNNAVGLSLTLLRLTRAHQVGILEMGMNAPGEIGYLATICEPDIGVIVNIGSGHLAGVGSLEGVAKAKGELVKALGESGTAIMNADDERVQGLAEKAAGPVVRFGVLPEADVRATRVQTTGAGLLFDLQLPGAGECRDVKLPAFGRYMVTNALAAAAIGDLLGVSGREIKKGLESFSPAPGRMNIMKTAGGFYLIDDTYNANPGSMEAAISGLCAVKGDSRGIVVLGDMFELGEYAEKMHEEVGALAASADLAIICAVGDFAAAIEKGALDAGLPAENVVAGTKAEVLEKLSEIVRPGDWVLIKGSRGMNMETVVAAMKEYGQYPNIGGRR